MKTIYLDSDYMCHSANDGTRQAVETDFFDGMCAGALECYRYIPAGQAWTRPDGIIIPGLFIQAVKESIDIQRQHELDEAQRLAELGIPQEHTFTATRNYSVDSFLAVYGELYEVITAIPDGCSITIGQNIIETTVEHYLDTLKEEK